MQSVVDAQGIRFVIQEFMPGATCDELDDNVVMQLLDLHDRRLDLAEPGDPVHWPKALFKTLTVGGEKYCLHSSLRDHDQRTRSLIGRIEKFGGSIDELAMTGNDIVHWDLHPGNLLIDGGSLVAIVDTDFAVVGDAHFDLVTLALNSLRIPCSPRVKSLLSSVAFEELDDVRTQTYLAHHFVRYLDWTISKHRSDEIEFWLKCAEEMLRI
jgi:thiamine kinase-like enzyme